MILPSPQLLSSSFFKAGNVAWYCLGHMLGKLRRTKVSNAGRWRWISVWFWWSSMKCLIMYSNFSQSSTLTFLKFGKTVPQLLEPMLSWSPMSVIMCFNSSHLLIVKVSNNILEAMDRMNIVFIFDISLNLISLILHKICDCLERHWARFHMLRGYEFDFCNYIIS